MEFVNHSTAVLIKHNASDLDVCRSAWVSNYGAEAQDKEVSVERITGLINFLYRERHHSPFEHGSFTFFVDTPIFVAREFMRHRTWSYNEVSGRYKQMEPRFYVPDNKRPLVQQGKVGAYTFVPGTDEQYAIMRNRFERSFSAAWGHYEEMLDTGIAREVARDVLPLSLMTQFYATANPRNVIQFLLLRNDKHALKEIRDVAEQIEEQFKIAMPLTYEAYRKQRDTWEKIQQILNVISLDDLLYLVDNKDHLESTLHSMKRTGSLEL